MRGLAIFILFLAFWSVSFDFNWTALCVLIGTIIFLGAGTAISFFAHTERFIHRDQTKGRK